MLSRAGRYGFAYAGRPHEHTVGAVPCSATALPVGPSAALCAAAGAHRQPELAHACGGPGIPPPDGRPLPVLPLLPHLERPRPVSLQPPRESPRGVRRRKACGRAISLRSAARAAPSPRRQTAGAGRGAPRPPPSAAAAAPCADSPSPAPAASSRRGSQAPLPTTPWLRPAWPFLAPAAAPLGQISPTRSCGAGAAARSAAMDSLPRGICKRIGQGMAPAPAFFASVFPPACESAPFRPSASGSRA